MTAHSLNIWQNPVPVRTRYMHVASAEHEPWQSPSECPPPPSAYWSVRWDNTVPSHRWSTAVAINATLGADVGVAVGAMVSTTSPLQLPHSAHTRETFVAVIKSKSTVQKAALSPVVELYDSHPPKPESNVSRETPPATPSFEIQSGSVFGARVGGNVGAPVVGSAVVGDDDEGAAVVGTAVVGAAVVGVPVVGWAVVGVRVVGSDVVGSPVVGAAEVGPAVVGCAVVGRDVTGASVVGA
jgi:hypothetical protein